MGANGTNKEKMLNHHPKISTIVYFYFYFLSIFKSMTNPKIQISQGLFEVKTWFEEGI